MHDGPLDAGQLDLAHQVACSEHVLTVGIGPAGAGKTTAMKLAIAAVEGAGLHAHGVTVSAAAAEQLQQATGMPSSTIAKWLLDIEHGIRGVAAGDVIVVDEAGMASARDLARITEIAARAGAFVRLVGDDRQLQAIGAGGAVRMVAAEVGAVRLDQVHRFHGADEAAASLQLREHGNVDWYITNHRIHGGNVAKVMGDIVDGWAADEAAGRSSLMIAGTNHEIATLNVMAQERRVTDGEVDLTAGVVELADGNRAGVGDRVVTRRNDRRMTLDRGQGFVKNGDLWTVVEVLDDGAVRVVDPLGRGAVLPAEYVAVNTGLGYATTVHRAQGQTVDNARILITNTTSRESLYVGLTRGRATNEVYAITDGASAVEQVRRAAANVSQAVSARELIAEAQRGASHPATLVRILRDMQQRADQHRYTATIRRELPQVAGLLIESDKRDRLYAAIARAEDAGFSPARILQLAGTELPERGGDPTGLIAWRINRHLATTVERRGQEQRRPLRDVSDLQLADLLERAGDHKDSARSAIGDALRASRNTKPRPDTADVERPVQPVVDDATRDRLLALSAAAAAFYASQYPGSGAAAYITERFGSDLTEHDVGVGYAPAGWDTLTQHLRAHLDATDTELVDAGLARVSKRGTLIDVFRDRVTFALRNADGQIVGFTARCNPDVDDPRTPKYINTPATAIFTKGEVLYGLAEGRDALAAGAIPVRVEGPMDAIAVTLAGDGHAVGIAPMGTALTAAQGELIAAASTTGIVLSALDLDKAGQAAAVKDYRTYTALGLDARELMLVNQVSDEPIKDPADAYRIDPTSLGLALTLPEIAPSMAAQVIRHRLQGDPHIAEHVGAQIRAARDIGAALAGLPLDRIVAEIDSAAAAIAHYAGAEDAVGDYRRTITEAALRHRAGRDVDQDPDVANQQHVVDDVEQLRRTLDGHPARNDYDQVLNDLHAQLEAPGSAVSWSTRRHGALADEQLTAKLHEARATTRILDGAIAETRATLRELRAEQRRAAGTGGYAAALQGRADRLARHVDRLHDDRNHQLKVAAEIHSEIQLRQRLSSEQWVAEQAGRDAARLSSGTAVAVDEARQRWRNASEVQRNLWLEQRARTFDADPGINKRPAGTPAWAVPGRGADDPATPTSWRPVLDDMAGQVAAAITDRGAAIALEPPTWASRYLGEVPVDQALRTRWERLAGQIETWRGLTDHQDPVKALPTPSRSHDASRTPETHLHTLHAAASDLRRDILNARLDDLLSSFEDRLPPAPPRSAEVDHLQAVAVEAHRAASIARATVVDEVLPVAVRASTDVDQAPLDALQRRVAAIHVDAHAQRAAQLGRVVDQTAARLDELRLTPLADGESGLDRIADADKVRADLAAAQQRAAAHAERGPRTPEQILGSLQQNVAALADGVKAARQHAADRRQDRAIAASLQRLDALEARGREPGVAPIEILRPWAQEKTRLEQLLAARHPGQDLNTLLDRVRPGRPRQTQRPAPTGTPSPASSSPADEIRRIAEQQRHQRTAPAQDRGQDERER